MCFFFINGNKVETFYNGHFGDKESRRYGAVSVGVKYDTDIFLGFNIFILKRLSVTCKFVTQSKYINKTETKQK